MGVRDWPHMQGPLFGRLRAQGRRRRRRCRRQDRFQEPWEVACKWESRSGSQARTNASQLVRKRPEKRVKTRIFLRSPEWELPVEPVNVHQRSSTVTEGMVTPLGSCLLDPGRASGEVLKPENRSRVRGPAGNNGWVWCGLPQPTAINNWPPRSRTSLRSEEEGHLKLQ